MARYLSVLVAALVLAIIQVCSTFHSDEKAYQQSLGNLASGMPSEEPGLVDLYEDGTQPWQQHDYIRHPSRASAVFDDEYQIVLDGGLFLGIVEEAVGYPARLVAKPSEGTIWKLIANGGEQMHLQNKKTGLYLAYDPKVPDFPVWNAKVPQPFILKKLNGGITQILTARPIGSAPTMAIGRYPNEADPPYIGLSVPSEDKTQAWRLSSVAAAFDDDGDEQDRFWDDKLYLWLTQ
ncbi:hypothetical protein DFQ26_000551 [Actinomortierella ambigua]|nr:hypothetical protein DFQ26_000551 [Actinomortierella ambigua]